jgi:F-type H+-transporting ATPase subunit c
MLETIMTALTASGPLLDPVFQAGGGITGTAKQLAAGLAIGLGGIGPGIGIGIAVNGAMQAIGRNPDAAGEIRGAMILGAGLAEAVAIYAFVVALILLFV